MGKWSLLPPIPIEERLWRWMFLTWHVILVSTPARPLWAPQPLTSGQGARPPGQARGQLSDRCFSDCVVHTNPWGPCFRAVLISELRVGPSESVVSPGAQVLLLVQGRTSRSKVGAGVSCHVTDFPGIQVCTPNPQGRSAPLCAPALGPHLQLPQALPFQLEPSIAHTPGQADVEGRVLQGNSRV